MNPFKWIQRLLRQEEFLAQIVGVAMHQAEEWDRFWAAMGVHSEDITVEQAIAKWQAYEGVVKAARALKRARLAHASHWSSACRTCEAGEGRCPTESQLWLAEFDATKAEHDALSALEQMEARP